jgi:ParB family chromosome partitioning protein
MKRLGKGLDALIKIESESVDKTTGITTLKISYIHPNRYQPRKKFNDEKLIELSKSLKENGMIQPIIVTKQDNTNYELIAGERRWRAAKLAGFSEIPVIVRSVSPQEQLQYAIIENIQRENLNPIDEAKAFKQLNEEFNLTHSKISEMMGKDRATITNSIRLLKLPEIIQDLILTSKITSGHARAILQLEEKYQIDFANYIVENKLSVRKAEIMSKKINEFGWDNIENNHKKNNQNSVFGELEKTLNFKYRTNVKIKGNASKGKIIFTYKNQKEYKQLIFKLKSNE